MDKSLKNTYAVILAGGSGTRFWPKSRLKTPKQLCKIGNSESTMIEQTLSRLDELIPPERRIIVTHMAQAEATKKIVRNTCKTVLQEPEARNTSAALALAALEIQKIADSKSAVMVSLHADAIIRKPDNFIAAIKQAIMTATDNYLTLVGVTPTYAETGYGYIEAGKPIGNSQTKKVQSFREKPSQELAEEYLRDQAFTWNSGIFVWKTGVMLEELSKNIPIIESGLTKLSNNLNKAFSEMTPQELAPTYTKLPKIAIDNAILEVSDRVAVVKGDLGWQDVGSWGSLSRCFPVDENGNLIYGQAVLKDCTGMTVDTDGPLVAGIGLKNLVIVKSGNAILVCPNDRSQDVKKVVENLATMNREEYT